MSLVDRALAQVSGKRLTEVVTAMVDVPSPTGRERPLAEAVVGLLQRAGLEGHLQALDADQANAWGRVRGDRTGPDLLLYSPIDTLTTGDPAVDLPWAGPELRPDMLPRAEVVDGTVTGLGAMNPKGHAACVLVAAEAVAAAGVPLRGDLLVGFGAGGMPTNAWDDTAARRNVGQGVGCSFLLEQGVWPDYAVIAKSHWSVSRQEVGLAWLDVTVSGIHTYVGARHRLPYRSPIVDAARLVPLVERWLLAWPGRWADGEVEPQGVIGAIEGGWSRMAAVVPAACRLRLDVRLAPGVAPLEARRSLAAFLRDHAAELDGARVDVELALAIPGSETPADSWVVRAAVDAWEAVAGRPHVSPTGGSGATDANILRNRGVPTARVGLPKVAREGRELDFTAGMNTVDVAAMEQLTALLVRVAVDTCTRTLEEVAS